MSHAYCPFPAWPPIVAVAVVHINSIGGLPNNAQGYPDMHKVLQQAYEDAMTTVAVL
jgi:hypothetical protein